jgi:hypothetical protein
VSTSQIRRLALMTASVAVAGGVAGCGTSTVSGSDVASRSKTALNQQLAAQGRPERVLTVSCPNDLDAKTGASEACPATGTGGAKFNVTAKVTSVKGSTASLSFGLAPASSTTTSNTTTT